MPCHPGPPSPPHPHGCLATQAHPHPLTHMDALPPRPTLTPSHTLMPCHPGPPSPPHTHGCLAMQTPPPHLPTHIDALPPRPPPSKPTPPHLGLMIACKGRPCVSRGWPPRHPGNPPSTHTPPGHGADDSAQGPALCEPGEALRGAQEDVKVISLAHAQVRQVWQGQGQGQRWGRGQRRGRGGGGRGSGPSDQGARGRGVGAGA